MAVAFTLATVNGKSDPVGADLQGWIYYLALYKLRNILVHLQK
jgi:hypothetical protein